MEIDSSLPDLLMGQHVSFQVSTFGNFFQFKRPPRPLCGLAEKAHILNGCGSTSWLMLVIHNGLHSHNPPSTSRQPSMITRHWMMVTILPLSPDEMRCLDSGSFAIPTRWLGSQVSSRNWKKRCATFEATLTAAEWQRRSLCLVCDARW